jgi:3',5'-cyclic AMP phosphodiesterase CpdA
MRSQGTRGWLVLPAVAALALAAGPLGAQQPVPAKPYYRAGPLPDRIVLTWAGDPARSQAVTWRTDVSVREGLAQVAVAAAGPDFVAGARTVRATTRPVTTPLGTAHYHRVHFEGLAPGTCYVYRVGDGRRWSEWNQFRTAADRPGPFTFLYLGDAQDDTGEHVSRVVREGYTAAGGPRFILHAGDLVNVGNSDAQWGEWFEAAGWINRTVPCVPVAGNHEYVLARKGSSPAPGQTLTPLWQAQFALPDNGPPGLKGSAYYLDFQGLRLVCLNSNERPGSTERLAAQVPWLERVLAGNRDRWSVVSFHHPLLPMRRDNPEVRRLWKPVLDKYRVDLVLQGHDHTYARSRPAESRTVYALSVSGPKLYHLERKGWMRAAREGVQTYQVIRVDGDRLRYEAHTPAGELVDRFELRKGPGGSSVLAEETVPGDGGGPFGWRAGAALLVVLAAVLFLVLRRARRAARDGPGSP